VNNLDGKPYTIQQDRGERQVTLRRISDRAVESRSEWSDGDLRSTITISGDGKTLERVMVFRDRAGKTRRWVEIYEKKQ
jgi:hypothetical protein